MARAEEPVARPEFDEEAARAFWVSDFPASQSPELIQALVECDRVHHELEHRPPSDAAMRAAAHAAVEKCSRASLRDFLEQAVSVAPSPDVAEAVLEQLAGDGGL